MPDNITGFGSGADEISLGLNFSSNVGSTTNDFNTLDQVLQQIIKDEETFNGIQNDSFEKAKAITQEIRSSGQEGQQLISIFKALRGEQQGALQDAKQFASVYQQINNELQKSVQNKSRLGVTSPGSGVPGSIPPTGGPGPIPGVPATQTGAGGGGGIVPPNTSPTAGFAEDPDDFFGKEEIKSGARRPSSRKSSDVNLPGIDPSELEDIDLTPADIAGGPKGSSKVRRGSVGNEHYKTFSDLALSIFPGQGYYSRLRRARWLARNEGGAIAKFTNSAAGQRMGMALNRLGGGNKLRTNEGYQLFPFRQNENGDYIDDNDNVVNGKYGLQGSDGKFLSQGGEGAEQPTWSWSGNGPMPPMPTKGDPQRFDPWSRPNLNYTGEGAAKVAGTAYALNVLKNKGGDLFREGQLYTGITGGTSVRGALGYDLGAQLTSWFGLNPLESYGQAKQITMQNLALGYRGNLLNQANSFGNNALQKYGVDPQTSMQMFGQMVMQAGASLNDLETSLATLAHTASTTNTSFAMLQQGVIQYSQIGSSIGLTGSQNALFATSAAQFAAGQPALQAAGGNAADILDSMVGQALVAQQMGTSYLGLPQAVSTQGGGALLDSVVKVNQSLLNRIGLNKSNYRNKTALRNAYFKYQLLMNALGRHKEANEGIKAYEQQVADTFDGKSAKEYRKTVNSKYAQNINTGNEHEINAAGLSVGAAIAQASDSFGDMFPDGTSSISQEMKKIQEQHKWNSIGINFNGKYTSLNDIMTMPDRERQALYAKIATGDITLSHVNRKGQIINGNYANGTYLDLQGKQSTQYAEFGRTPDRAAMHRAENKAVQIELGPRAQKIFTLLDNPAALYRYLNKFDKATGLPLSSVGTPRAGNNS